MKSPRFSTKQKQPKAWGLRRVSGESMLLTLRPGQLVFVSGWFWRLKPGHVVVFRHNGLEKIKRITAVDAKKGYFVEGDNRKYSTDSRHFGWIPRDAIIARVIVPRNISDITFL